MKMHLLAAAAALLIGTSAQAADPSQVYGAHQWSGGYVGLQGGGAWGDSNHTNNVGITSGNFDLEGGFGGWNSGWDWQRGNWVYGLAGDTSFGDIDGSSTAGACGAGCYTEVKWITTYRGRLGYAMGNFLPYATAGLAMGTVEAGLTGTAFRNDDFRVGWVAGAGVEVAIDENYRVKAEYTYVDLGEVDYAAAAPTTFKADAELNIFRFGVSRRFNIFEFLSR